MWNNVDRVCLNLCTAAVQQVTSEGYASTIMEDHFDVGAHYMHHVVDTVDGTSVVVEGIPHGQQFRGEYVKWSVMPKQQAPLKKSAKPSRGKAPFE